MKIIIASDSFKGSLTAAEANEAIASGLRDAFPQADMHAIAIGDGGEGTCQSLVDAMHGEMHSCVVPGPLGDPVEAHYGIVGDGMAVVEMSEASGLTLVAENRRDPMRATSFGTGLIIRHAVEKGCRTVVAGLGGSATTDGGTGMLAALGARFFDSCGNVLEPCGHTLRDIAGIDVDSLSRFRDVRFIVASDVGNPLYGTCGAACVFAPQKGTSAAQVVLLDEGLKNYARVAEQLLGVDYSRLPGAGAAGGMGFAFAAFLNGQMCSGADIVLDAWHFDELLRDTDVVITGEGRVDSQTLMGKAPCRVLERCVRAGVPVIAVGGSVRDSEALLRAGFAALVQVDAGGVAPEEAMRPPTAFANLKKSVIKAATEIATKIK